jgi:hypothetical protein
LASENDRLIRGSLEDLSDKLDEVGREYMNTLYDQTVVLFFGCAGKVPRPKFRASERLTGVERREWSSLGQRVRCGGSSGSSLATDIYMGERSGSHGGTAPILRNLVSRSSGEGLGSFDRCGSAAAGREPYDRSG